jgi:Uma2 family endonuclease
MSVAQVSSRLTLEQYETLPELADGNWEVRDGELFKVTFPKPEHRELQFRLANLLNERLRSGRALPEYPYVANREPLELRGADVAWLRRDRRPPRRQYLEGAPELVIEILSPSNTAREMNRKEQLSFAAGTRQFWLVDMDDRTVRVTGSDGSFQVYAEGDCVALEALEPGADSLPVALVFENTG